MKPDIDKNAVMPTVLIVLGATGDLMTKKIVPALFNLHKEGQLPRRFRLVGVSRRDWTDDDFRRHIKNILRAKAQGAKKRAASVREIRQFLELASYHKMAFRSPRDYADLGALLKNLDASWGICSSKLFYLAVPPQFYRTIFENLHKSGLTDPCSPEEGWTRVIVEKPFGSDAKSAKELDKLLAALFREVQIYRIDHYLAKEMLQNIIAFRFGNNLFEGGWNKDLVERINIRLLENIGVEDRGTFYDGVGALRDVGQNHILQMLALIAMDRPEKYDADSIRVARAELLRSLKIPSLKEAVLSSFRAQYEGYRAIKGVASDSDTETYFKLRGSVDSGRWEGVPVFLESGKRLGEPPLKEIEIVLRHKMPCLCPDGVHYRNRIVIRLEPKEEIMVTFYSKKPGLAREFEERFFHFKLREAAAERSQYTKEYEKLLLDCISGDQTLFVSSEEIAAMWRFTDPFTSAWQKGLVPLHRYLPDKRSIIGQALEVGGTEATAEPVRREIGIIGLGKMGSNLALNLKEKGWRVVAYNRDPRRAAAIEGEGIESAAGFNELAQKLPAPRLVWLMVTAGKAVDEILFGGDGLARKLKKGDILIDGGNSFFEDSARRAKILRKSGIGFLDAGVSGGPYGARRGASLMIGGDKKAFLKAERLFADISVEGGYAYFGEAGAGHFVKMAHNGIEYGMMQSLAEGFALMKRSPYKLDLEKVAGIYNHGSVIESRLVGWLRGALKNFGPELKKVSGSVAYTGEGEWTVKTGKKWKMKLPVIEDAFKFRVRSKKLAQHRDAGSLYMGKILSALRNMFGGHSAGGGKH